MLGKLFTEMARDRSEPVDFKTTTPLYTPMVTDQSSCISGHITSTAETDSANDAKLRSVTVKTLDID